MPKPNKPDAEAEDPPIIDACIKGDLDRVRALFDAGSLTLNSRGGRSLVHIAAQNGHLDLTVADEGPGIVSEDQQRVFERFWRADPSRVRRTGGTGLGLAIVASLVQAHGGTISLLSEPGKGASFTVRLPLAPGP